MSRSQSAGIARHAVDASQARAQREQQKARRNPEPDRAEPQSLSNQAIAHALGSGAPLEPAVRAEMEKRFGTDFGDVRIHDEVAGQQIAQQLSASAFAVGNQIAFNRGHYAPATRDGKYLLAHELAHVIQQRRAGPTAPQLAGGPLEAAAQRAASDVVGGSGPVRVSGASAVGVARQPLPEEPASDLPPPRSLAGSLRKSEDALSDEALHREIDLIEQWLDRYPVSSGSDHLALELDELIAEDMSRTGRRAKEEASRPKPAEESVAALAGIVHQGRLEAEEVAAAHRSYRATGRIPQTVTPFAPVEVKRGLPMSRARRYDLMMLKQGKPHPQIEDLTVDNRDDEYLSAQEFKDEFWRRHNAEWQQCDDDHWFRGPTYKCQRKVDEKYGGPAFKSWRDNQEWQLYLRIMEVSEKISAVRESGPIATLGRVVGYGAGAATGHDALEWSEYGADLGGMGDVGFSMYGGMKERARLQSYSGGGGLELTRDADIQLMQPRTSALDVTPPELTPTPPSGGAAPTQFPQSRPAGATGATNPPTGGALPAPIPIGSGKGLPQSEASKALLANLARQSPEKVGSISSLPAGKSAAAPSADPAQQAVPAAAAEEQQIAVGQTHGPGTSAQTAQKPQLSAIQGGNQPTVASRTKPAGKPSSAAGSSTPVRTTAAKRSPGTALKGGSLPAGGGGRKPARVPPGKATQLPAFNASGGRGANAEPLVAVRMQGGGAARKGTYFIEGTPEFEAAAKDKSYSVMPRSQAIEHKFRPAGTPFDPTIEPLKINGVQVESNAAGTGKGNKHNISARADILPTEKARKAAFEKTTGASVTEAHGHKTLLQGGEIGVLRPGNASTGGVDSITADVGKTPSTGRGGAAHDPAGTPAATPASQAPKSGAKVFLNDFTGPKTSKGAKSTHLDWVRELGEAVTHPLFGFGNKQFDDAVHDATLKGDVYVRTVRIQRTREGIKVTPEAPRKVAVPPAVKKAVVKFREDKSK